MKSKYYNRDLSWLLFDNRVIDQAYNAKVPLLEKLRFLSIASNNLDEFFGVRMHNVYSMISKKKIEKRTGLNGIDLLSLIHEFNARNITKQYEALFIILERLKDKGVFQMTTYDFLTDDERNYVQEYYLKHVVNELKVTPFSSNLKYTTNLNILLCSENELYNIAIPDDIDRLVKTGVDDHYILLEDLITNISADIWRKYDVKESYTYRLSYDKNKKYDFLEEGLSDEVYLDKMTDYINNRGTRRVTRVEFSANNGDKGRSFFASLLGINKKSVYRIPGPLDLKFLDKLFKKYEDQPGLVFEPFNNLKWKNSQNILHSIEKQPMLIQYPYASFDVFLKFLKTGIEDPDTTSIKMTIYRTEKKSKVVNLLKEAARKGINVTVVVELRARFDEKHNLDVATDLESAGVHVVYGDRLNKVHAKICLILQESKNKGYVQIGTGNYNAVTANVFTDLSFFTSDKRYVDDAIQFFGNLALTHEDNYNMLATSPVDLKQMIITNIKRATKDYLRTGDAEVFIKVNGLTDIEVINAIYSAARLGLPFRIIVRGPCCLKLGICGPKEDIVVKSIVGELLEHSRIYKFKYGEGNTDLWISSADLMTRNLDRRVEIAMPIVDEKPKRELLKIIKMFTKDTANSYYLNANGEYVKKRKFINKSAQQTWLSRLKWKKYI
ncbi:polyphosphate kinase 1 [Companilactobacillus mishanensis]|uniref:Polyphosphate kinase n=1 Tax=Companilactobacillus mishanensis TaxID=2486008 RepID=A0ABW9P3W5_9LACO|nr:polyphosphate kinase 1 [Companilactobacillus mishanensis]MQS43898.1 polyphosphate kinase 1 [Companilactobacillus mishanensis]